MTPPKTVRPAYSSYSVDPPKMGSGTLKKTQEVPAVKLNIKTATT
jgi:hypothetical protein